MSVDDTLRKIGLERLCEKPGRSNDIEDVLADKNSFTGDVVVRRWIVEDPFMMRGVRAYTSSDPYNHINYHKYNNDQNCCNYNSSDTYCYKGRRCKL